MAKPRNPEVDAEVDAVEYWKRPDDLKLPRAYWEDPEQNVRGMLSADRIQYYVELFKNACGIGMIEPFDSSNLKPASYELTLGPWYQIEGKDGVLTEKCPMLVIPRNSIAFVSMQEKLLLPHYIAARFNLSIDLIYTGLLLGTGPQVDPGFKGVLSCPLHNISNNPIKIRLGDPFAKIDFVKTTGFCEGAPGLLETVQTEAELYDRKEELVGHEGYKNRLFKEDKCWRQPILGYPPGVIQVRSSVARLARTVKRFRRIGFFGTVGGLALVATLVILNTSSLQVLDRARAEREKVMEAFEANKRESNEAQSRLEARLGEIEAILEKQTAQEP